MKYIHSVKNKQVKQWKKLYLKKEREKTGLFLVEGFHLVEEALKAKRVNHLIISEEVDNPNRFDFNQDEITIVTKEVIEELSSTETPQGIIAVCIEEGQEVEIEKGKTFLLIDAVQDPGNLGTIIRTADAAGIDFVIVGEGSVDVYNEKVLRAAQGSHFHLPILKGNLIEWISKLKEMKIHVFGSALTDGVPYPEITPPSSFALIVGNEGKGVQAHHLQLTDNNLYIPILGKSESLNVAVATGILLYYLRNL